MKKHKLAIIGLGYVGLPLAVEFGKKYSTIGFDINKQRVEELNNNFDHTQEVSSSDLINRKSLTFSSSIDKITSCNYFFITVPTPIDDYKTPDLHPLKAATSMIGDILKKGDVVVYESTVYPGCTEEFCVPILEKKSGLKYNKDFFCGYSPERIVPGDKVNTLTTIKKVTSGSNEKIAEEIDLIYKSIISAGTFKASSIKVAEASKAIENAQRDLNISFVNELALIFEKLGIDTQDVLDAAATKWNFKKYTPGLVGGHCISVDPYYLAYKAQSVGYHPDVILSGRRVNDNMSKFVADKFIKLLIEAEKKIKGSRVLILGITFKENCPDIRNTKVSDVYNELIEFGLNVDVYDPVADNKEVLNELGINLIEKIDNVYDGILLSVSHNVFKEIDYNKLKINEKSIIYDLKGFLPRDIVNLRL